MTVQFINKGNDTAEIVLYGEVGGGFWGDGIIAKDFAKELKALGTPKVIECSVNSYGGDVFEGFAIYNILKQHPATKIMNVQGIAASIMSVIICAGDEIHAAENSHIMIHNPYGFTMGDSAAMRDTADLLDKLRDSIAGVYTARTGKPAAYFETAMNAETWYTAQEAFDIGLCTKVSANKAIAACFDPQKFGFKNMPKDLHVEINIEIDDDKEEEMEAAEEATETAQNAIPAKLLAAKRRQEVAHILEEK